MCAYNVEICYRMFTSIKETFSNLVQLPFGVVKAEDDELVDPHRVLRVRSTEWAVCLVSIRQ